MHARVAGLPAKNGTLMSRRGSILFVGKKNTYASYTHRIICLHTTFFEQWSFFSLTGGHYEMWISLTPDRFSFSFYSGNHQRGSPQLWMKSHHKNIYIHHIALWHNHQNNCIKIKIKAQYTKTFAYNALTYARTDVRNAQNVSWNKSAPAHCLKNTFIAVGILTNKPSFTVLTRAYGILQRLRCLKARAGMKRLKVLSKYAESILP